MELSGKIPHGSRGFFDSRLLGPGGDRSPFQPVHSFPNPAPLERSLSPSQLGPQKYRPLVPDKVPRPSGSPGGFSPRHRVSPGSREEKFPGSLSTTGYPDR